MRKVLGATAILAMSMGCAAEQAPPPPSPVVIADFWVFFDHDSAAISTTGAETIRQYARYIGKATRTRTVLTGHTDRSGNNTYNMDLSLRRAEAVKNALIAHGLPAGSIEARGRGETQPLVMTPDGVKEPQNRRVEFY